MASVYGSAGLTIAVNTDQNLFDTLFSVLESPRQYDAPDEWVKQYKRCYIENVKGGWTSMVTHAFCRFLYEGGIIGARAWCLQERQLSPRMIHLLDNGVMLWECPSLLSNTATPEHFSFMEQSKVASLLCKDNSRKLPMYQRYVDDYFRRYGNKSPDRHFEIWHTMLRDLSYRHLTYSSDNLVAIAGIAVQVHRDTGMTYLSGIWKEDIPRGLLWARNAEEGATTPGSDESTPVTMDTKQLRYNGHWNRFSGYQGPSWSWCSIDGPTQLIEHDGSFRELMQVSEKGDGRRCWETMVHGIEVWSTQGSDINAPLKPLQRGSYLSITGHLGRFQCSGEEVPLFHSSGRKKDSYVGPGVCPYNLSDLLQPDGNPGKLVRGAVVFDIPEECISRKVWCLCLAEAPRPHGMRNHLQSVDGRVCAALVLKRVPPALAEGSKHSTNHSGSADGGRPPYKFRRIGLALVELLRDENWTDCSGAKVQVRII